MATTDVTLGAAIRSNLLSLQITDRLIGRTQGRLSTGLEVASAIDNAKKFFEAKGLSDRASDFDDKKDGIDPWKGGFGPPSLFLSRFRPVRRHRARRNRRAINQT